MSGIHITHCLKKRLPWCVMRQLNNRHASTISKTYQGYNQSLQVEICRALIPGTTVSYMCPCVFLPPPHPWQILKQVFPSKVIPNCNAFIACPIARFITDRAFLKPTPMSPLNPNVMAGTIGQVAVSQCATLYYT